MSDKQEAFWNKTLHAARILSTLDYYTVLEIDANADGHEVQAAYYRRVRELHPDRYARETDPERKRALVSLSARLGEAYRVLSNPAQRKRYDDTRRQGHTRLVADNAVSKRYTPQDPANPSARKLFEQGLQHLERGDFKAAREQLRLALQFDRDSRVIRDALTQLDERTKPRGATSTAPKLSPATGNDQHAGREHPRRSVVAPVKVRCAKWSDVKNLYTHNVSRGGMFLPLKKTVPVDCDLTVEFRLPDGEQVALAGKVVRVVTGDADQPRGVGIRFQPLSAETQKLFDRVLAMETDVSSRPQADASPAPAVTEDALRVLAEAIAAEPASRSIRAAFYVALGNHARANNQLWAARIHFETALIFDRSSAEAAHGLAALKS